MLPGRGFTFPTNLTMRAFPSRSFEDEYDLQQMLDLLVVGRARTTDWRYAHVGELVFNYFMVACHLDPQEHIRLWHQNGKLVGYAILGEDPSLDFQIHPDYVWLGIEWEALAWAEAKLGELRQSGEAMWGGKLVSGARQDDWKRIEFLQQHGFRFLGEIQEVNMLRSLEEPIPDVRIPDGFKVREVAGTGEVANRANAQRVVWQPWTVGNVRDEEYDFFMHLPGYCRELDIVTVSPEGVITSYVNGWIDPINKIGDFGPVGALPAYRRRGLTRAVLLEGLHRMKKFGMNRVCISTGLTNTPAKMLYGSIGFKIENGYLDYIQER